VKRTLIVYAVISLMLYSCATTKPSNQIVEGDSQVGGHGKLTSGFLSDVLETWIDIDSSPEKVWDTLVDFPEWKRWNTFIPDVEGPFLEGKTLRITVIPPGLKQMNFEPEINTIIPIHQIVWGGGFLWFVYHGDHTFSIEPLANGKTRFRQTERFQGPMVLLMGGMIGPTEKGYIQMNAELKKEVEGR